MFVFSGIHLINANLECYLQWYLLALLYKRIKIDPKTLPKSANMLKIMLRDPCMLLKSPILVKGHPPIEIVARGELLEGRQCTIKRRKHYKTMKKPTGTDLNDGGIAAIRSGQSTI